MNKRFLLIGVIAALLICAFSSCSARGKYEDLLESRKEAEANPEKNENIVGTGASDYQTSVILKTGDTPFYEGKDLEDLKAVREKTGAQIELTVTTIGRLYEYNGQELPLFYNKLTGNFSNWCSDPLCDGSQCIWKPTDMWCDRQYISDNHIYFLVDGNFETGKYDYGIYRCDLQRNNITRIMDVASSHDGIPEEVKVVAEINDVVYYTKKRYVDKKSIMSLYALDMATGESKMISGDLDLSTVKIIQDNVYYTTAQSFFTIYKSDLIFTESKLFWENAYIQQYNDRYIIVIIMDDYSRYSVDLQTGKHVRLPDFRGQIYLSGDYLYYTRDLTEEEIQSDVQKDYYTYTWLRVIPGFPQELVPDVWLDAETQGAGKIYRVSLREEDAPEECVFQLLYKDVPVRIHSVEMDGDVAYVAFHNYAGFKNYYNQEFDEDEDAYLCHAVVDFQNGTVTLLKLPK